MRPGAGSASVGPWRFPPAAKRAARRTFDPITRKFLTRREHAARLGVKYGTLLSRLNKWGADDPRTWRTGKLPGGGGGNLESPDGVRGTIGEHAARLGLSRGGFCKRLRVYGPADPYTWEPPHPRRKLLTSPDGVTDTISGHARRLGLNRQGMLDRLSRVERLDDPRLWAPRQAQRAPGSRLANPVTGEMDTLSGHAARLGRSYSALCTSISRHGESSPRAWRPAKPAKPGERRARNGG